MNRTWRILMTLWRSRIWKCPMVAEREPLEVWFCFRFMDSFRSRASPSSTDSIWTVTSKIKSYKCQARVQALSHNCTWAAIIILEGHHIAKSTKIIRTLGNKVNWVMSSTWTSLMKLRRTSLLAGLNTKSSSKMSYLKLRNSLSESHNRELNFWILKERLRKM